MGKHSKPKPGSTSNPEDMNTKPFNSSASPEQKAKEFDKQYGQNRKYDNAPNATAKGFFGRRPKHG